MLFSLRKIYVMISANKHDMDPNSILNYPLSENRESRIFNFLISKKVGSIVSRVAGVGGGSSTLPCSKSKQETGDRVSLFLPFPYIGKFRSDILTWF